MDADHSHSLFIDVWTPANATAEEPTLPVKVWLYGGANEAGGISNPTYDGCTASENVIQVSINYRVGPLGFLSSQALNLTGNQGTQDQLLGLRWVQENIGAFGGNASKVLLFGQSAGGLNTLVLSSLPQAPSLMSAAILESSPASSLSTAADVQTENAAFVQALGCGETDVACVRAANVTAISTAYTASGATSNPVVDGTVIAKQPLDAGVKVPAIAGSTTQEGTLFLLAGFGLSISQVNATTYNNYLTVTYGSQAQLVNQTYPLSKYAGAGIPALAAMTDLITDQTFRCPARRFVRQAAEDGVPVWTYR